MKITRRGSLLGIGALIGIGAGASFLACGRGRDAAAAITPEKLRIALADIIAPERVGSAYRKERDHVGLAAELAEKPGLLAATRQSCPATLRAHVRAQVQEDFRRGDIVVADRFVMARSECILAALATDLA